MLNVQEVMTKVVVSVQATDCMDEALDVLVQERVSALPVIDHRGHCVGVLSITRILDLARDYISPDSDLGRFTTIHHSTLIEELGRPQFGAKEVRQMMLSPPLTVLTTTSLEEAAQIMTQHHVHRLFVVDRKNKLLGVVSTMDVLRGWLASKICPPSPAHSKSQTAV